MKLWREANSQKQQQNYQSVSKTLRKNGVDSIDKAEACRLTMLKNAKLYTLLAFIVLMLFVVLLPQAAAWAIAAFLCLIVWIWVTTVSGRRHVMRFIEEELGGTE